jgi:signal peptidase II
MKLENVKMYAFLASSLLFIDRLAKHLVMCHVPYYQVNHFLCIDLVFNRGVSFGFFHSSDATTFTAVNILIGCVISLLAAHSYVRIVNNKLILGEVFIFTGAVSNVIDRYMHGGVVDFIALSYQDWHFAVFNIADCFIFFGVILMFILEYKESWEKPVN